MSARWWRPLVPLLLLLPVVAACGHDDDTPPAPRPTASGAVTVPLGDRPFQLYVPNGYTAGQAMPLVVLLHGYTSNSTEQANYFSIVPLADQRGFLLALPDGTTDSSHAQFWNATDACCNFNASSVDDSTYLSQVIDTVKASYAVDATRVYLFGHSNGGFMAHRMACDHADQITAIASLAGAVWKDATKCTPSRPVSVLQIHGTGDTTIRYAGGNTGGPGAGDYPGAVQTFDTWRDLDGCSADITTTANALDLDTYLAGAETDILAAQGCRDGSQVQLWRIANGLHVPTLTEAFSPAVLDFLFAQRSPAA